MGGNGAGYTFLAFLAIAPFLAISERLAAGRAFALAGPPFLPPREPSIAAALFNDFDCNGLRAIINTFHYFLEDFFLAAFFLVAFPVTTRFPSPELRGFVGFLEPLETFFLVPPRFVAPSAFDLALERPLFVLFLSLLPQIPTLSPGAVFPSLLDVGLTMFFYSFLFRDYLGKEPIVYLYRLFTSFECFGNVTMDELLLFFSTVQYKAVRMNNVNDSVDPLN